jgi:hypothetical protein
MFLKWVGCVGLILAWTSSVLAGSFTVTTTPEQDAAIAQRIQTMSKWTVAAGATPPSLTPQQLVQQIISQALQFDVTTTQRTSDRAAACAKVTDAQVKQALGCAAAK